MFDWRAWSQCQNMQRTARCKTQDCISSTANNWTRRRLIQADSPASVTTMGRFPSNFMNRSVVPTKNSRRTKLTVAKLDLKVEASRVGESRCTICFYCSLSHLKIQTISNARLSLSNVCRHSVYLSSTQTFSLCAASCDWSRNWCEAVV